MPRVKQVHTIDEFPHDLDNQEVQAQVARTFARYDGLTRRASGQYSGATTVPNSFAQIFQVPRFGELIVDLTDFVVNDLRWAQQMKLRELAILTLYERQRCDYGYRIHLRIAAAVGVTQQQIADLPLYRASDAFNDEERDVIEFTHAELDNHVSDELFQRLQSRYGEQQMVEMTIVVAFWALWGMVINTLQPDPDSAH
jgi:alkylhydroperoxidase/carboxymuconolactone decarboxylase family protein YurZ